MKIRNGFVSNSSSSSFIIRKVNLTSDQIYQIKNHIETALVLAENNHLFEDFGYCEPYDAWNVSEKDESILVSTLMDNFDMRSFLKAIDIDENDITWREY